MRERLCEPVDFIFDTMTSRQLEQLSGLPREGNEVDRWYRIWDHLFPAVSRPPSPYLEDVSLEIMRFHLEQWLENHSRGTHNSNSPDLGHVSQEMQRSIVEQILLSTYRDIDALDVINTDTIRTTFDRSWTQSTPPITSFITPPQTTTVVVEPTIGGEMRYPNASGDRDLSGEFWDIQFPLSVPYPGAEVYRSNSNADEPLIGSLERSLTEPVDIPSYNEEDATQQPESAGMVPPSTPRPSGKVQHAEYVETLGYPIPPSTIGSIGKENLARQAGGSNHDSGYASLQPCETASKILDETTSVYSIDSIPAERRSRYVATFASRLAEDIRQISSFSQISEESLRHFPEWVRAFAMKLHGESSSMIQKEASVFLRKYRR
jgi:hypothetical protein